MRARTLLCLALPAWLLLAESRTGAAPKRTPTKPRAPKTAVAKPKPAQPAPPPPTPTGPLWTGESGGYRWTWGRTNVTAARGAAADPAFSLADMLGGEAARLLEGPGAPARAVLQYDLQPLSVVGPILSYRKERFHEWEGGPHPAVSASFHAVDVSRPGYALALTDLFPEAQVRQALLQDALVQKTLRTAGAQSPPRTTAELVRALSETTTGEVYTFSGDLLNRFAFHSVEGGKVAVRLGLSHGGPTDRGVLTQLGLLLTVPESLRQPMALAASRQQGFLMREQEAIARKRQIRLLFEHPAM